MAVKGWVFFCVAAGTFALYVEYSASESTRQEWICRERELMPVWNMRPSIEPCRLRFCALLEHAHGRNQASALRHIKDSLPRAPKATLAALRGGKIAHAVDLLDGACVNGQNDHLRHAIAPLDGDGCVRVVGKHHAHGPAVV